MHKENCFVTLTYRPLFMHKDRSLHMEDFQKFMKRLRKRFGKVRFFHCGEYGDKLNRPHYHACIFGFDFPDKVLWKIRDGVRLYRSKELEKLWYYGFSTVGDVNFKSAAYVARYVTKKVNGDLADKHYKGRCPEYVTMSRRPGIAASWFQKYGSDVFPQDYMVVNGVRCKPVRYYDNMFDVDNPEQFGIIKLSRVEKAKANPDNTLRRMRVREKVKLVNFTQLKRGFEKCNLYRWSKWT